MQMQFSELNSIYSVSEINHQIKLELDQVDRLKNCWVTGEISNLSKPASGHIYLTLKDSNSQLRAVIWKTNAFRLQRYLRDGALVEAHGNVVVYENGGIYQLNIDEIRISGEGQLYLEFIQLKNKLEAEGIFAPSRKVPLPEFPRKIGIITSPTGAALQDILHTIGRRFPLAYIILSPAAVQGVEAPAALLAALDRLIHIKIPPDVIIIARGGGSIEDLWAFNDEGLVRAVSDCPIPIISGVGHETDFTLVDFAADQRAPTPTAAAEMSTPNAEELRAYLRGWQSHLDQLAVNQIFTYRQQLENRFYQLERYSPIIHIQNGRQTLDFLAHRMGRAYQAQIRLEQARLKSLSVKLAAIDPFAVLQRGYALVSDAETNQLITSVTKVASDQKILVKVSDGSFGAKVD